MHKGVENTRALLPSALVGLTRHLLDISTREPTLLALLDEGTIPPSTHWVFGRMSLNHYILNKREILVPLSFVGEDSSDSEGYC